LLSTLDILLSRAIGAPELLMPNGFDFLESIGDREMSDEVKDKYVKIVRGFSYEIKQSIKREPNYLNNLTKRHTQIQWHNF
jgi:hypothetical protein